MDSVTPLDYALFQLSPRRTRCELFISGDGKTEKLASGFLKPFVAHLRVAEEQASQAVQPIKLEPDKRRNATAWFNKGTLERFVRFVSTPEVLELVKSLDAEMSQLEGARKIYSEGAADQSSGVSLNVNETARAAAADATKKELLRAIDVRLTAVKQDLTMVFSRASAAGFTLDNVSELLLFADCFGAQRLNEACTKFISLCQRRPELITQHLSSLPSLPTQWKAFDDGSVCASSGSDMSIDEPEMESRAPAKQLAISTSGPQLVHKSSNKEPSPHAAGELTAKCQQPKTVPYNLRENDVDKGTEEVILSGTSVEPAQQVGGGSRRLSVQDRINLFESKQKAQYVSSNTVNSSTSTGGTNKLGGKPEHRRLSSDVSMEKAVLRRWSSASDMSIDLNTTGSNSCNDQGETCSPAGTLSHVQSESKIEDEGIRLKDTAASMSQSGFRNNPIFSPSTSSFPSSKEAKDGAIYKDRDRTKVVDLRGSTTSSNMQAEPTLEKDRTASRTQLGVSLEKVRQGGSNDQGFSEDRSKAFSGSGEVSEQEDQAAFGTQFKEVSEEEVGVKDKMALKFPSRASATIKQVEQKGPMSMRPQPRDLAGMDTVEVKGQPHTMTKFRTFASKTEDFGVQPKGFLDSQVQFKASSGKVGMITLQTDSLVPQSKWRSFSGKADEGRKETAASNDPLRAFSTETEEGSVLEEKLQRQTSAPGEFRKFQGRMRNQVSAAPVSLGSNVKESMEGIDPSSTSSMGHIQAVKPLKGNQELNEELQVKANELEKLFAAHKLRVCEDQAASQRSKPADMKDDGVPEAVETRPAEAIHHHLPKDKTLRENSHSGVGFDAKLLLKMVDNVDCRNNVKQSVGNLRPSEDFRGRLYEKYMQKRDAKLHEDWGSKRAQKEAKMKALHDTLESSQAEMKTKFDGSTNRQDLSNARRRAERMRFFHSHSAKNKGQIAEFLQGEEETLEELSKHVHYDKDKSYSDTLFGGDHSRSNQSKKLLSTKVVHPNPQTPSAPIPRTSAKGLNSGSMKRRAHPENFLAQSVPNFSDFRKENTKPSTGLSKITPRTKSRNFARSKSSNEEINLCKEEKPQMSQSIKKISATPGELKDLPPLDSNCGNLTPLNFSWEQTEQILLNRNQRSGDSQPFLRKGNGIGPGAGVGMAKLKVSLASEILRNEEDTEGTMNQQEEEYERPVAEGKFGAMDFSVDTDSEKPRFSQELGNSGGPVSENGDILRLMSRVDGDFTAVPSKFDTPVGNMQESPGESPGSWNSHVHDSFSYVQEASDIDASVDSPTGSPAFWNSLPLNPLMEADAARMRRKWGSAQIPVLVTNAPHQSRKDVTKGFKRLLKFGRKGKGTEFLINDWVSTSTASEGDDDTEDGQDQVTRYTDDLRKSRMGYSVAAYDGLNESEVFRDQVQSLRSSIPSPPASFKLRDDHLSGSSLKAPRSFFSLSSFRSKGNESKFR